MEPIINPWTIYWINILANINLIANIIGVITIAASIIIIVVFFITSIEDPLTEEEQKELKKVSILLGSVLGTSFLISGFVPDKETLYTMFILNYITPDNIEFGVEGIKSIIEYIIETVNSIGG